MVTTMLLRQLLPSSLSPRSIPWLSLTLGLLAGASGCTRSGETSAAAMCEPATYVFCRCADSSAGTKRCNDEGSGFSECDSCEGNASDNNHGSKPGSGVGAPGDGSGAGSPSDGSGAGSPSDGSGAGSPSGGSGAGSPSGGSGGTTPVASKALLDSCSTHGQCLSNWCESGYCTASCQKVSDCPYPDSECVLTGDAAKARCMPSCQTALDCTDYGAPTSRCGHAVAIDSFSVRSCSHWGEDHLVPPYGTGCTPLNHAACNLGYGGRETVCTAHGVCAKGCFVDKDCPKGTSCSAQGELGTCK